MSPEDLRTLWDREVRRGAVARIAPGDVVIEIRGVVAEPYESLTPGVYTASARCTFAECPWRESAPRAELERDLDAIWGTT